MPTLTTKSTNVTFTREQVNFLKSFMTEKTEEFVSKLLEEDDEDTTEDVSATPEDYFTTNGFKIGKALPPMEEPRRSSSSQEGKGPQ